MVLRYSIQFTVCFILVFAPNVSSIAAQEKLHALTVAVTDETEQPVEGAVVEVRVADSLTPLSCLTNAEGTCTVAPLQPQALLITIRGPFHEPSTRALAPDGSLAPDATESAEWTPPLSRIEPYIQVQLTSTVSKARDALFKLKLASSRLAQSSQFAAAIRSVSGAISAFETISAVDQRTFVLADGVDIFTLAASLWLHVANDVRRSTEYLNRAEHLAQEVSARADHSSDQELWPDPLSRMKVMLDITSQQGKKACDTIKDAATTQGWWKGNDSDPLLASEGDTQWWTENHVREEFRDLALSIALAMDPPFPTCTDIALKLTLATKGRVLDATTRKISWLRESIPNEYQHYVSELQEIWDRQSLTFIKQAREGIGRRELEEVLKTPPWSRNKATKSPEAKERERLRTRESELLTILLRARRKTGVSDVSAGDRLQDLYQALPASTALLELCRYRPYTGRIGRNEKDSIFEADRYAGFLLQRNREPLLVDLGEAKEIDPQIRSMIESAVSAGDLPDEQLDRAHEEFRAISADLSRKILWPFLPNINNAEQLIIAPDSYLTSVPFAALLTPDGRYAIEHFLITYVASGNDLLRKPVDAHPEPSVLYGEPDFGHSRSPEEDPFDQGSISLTGSEVRSIRSVLGEGTVRTGPRANKKFLRTVNGPWILHLATHAVSDLQSDQMAGGTEPEHYLAAEILGFDRSIQLAPERPEEHLLRPKVALAAANSDPDEGVLTAAELSHLNLRGTRLATLSACQTSLGTIREEEGVYSLRRALAIAGSETQVTTLWEVDDEATKELMVTFYAHLAQGRGEALRLAQRRLASGSDPRLRHPYFWAGFQLSGDWRPLARKHQPVQTAVRVGRRSTGRSFGSSSTRHN